MIRTFSSRAGRLSATNKHFLKLNSNCVLTKDYRPIKDPREILIDIGFGDGISLTEDIAKCQEILFIGIEPYKKGFARMIEFYEKKQPNNLLLHNGCAKEFIKVFQQNVLYIRIHFPDPWPKKKHSKRRLVNKEFLKLISNILKPDGQVQILTDSHTYQEHIQELISKQKIFKTTQSFPIEYAVSTFHRKGLEKGHTIKEYNLKLSKN